ncbi:hypothetical protein PYW07_007400 [Mythimna separata]|uniref:Peptidase S1 domain-containing protein n=1 Tax=Mythimna separata TaxID=271217 RepID=A0AAD7Z2T6_MYTSE|nr:hypothetical protein PYW07_007400 [Mythimna separata]
MRAVILLLAFGFAVVAAVPTKQSVIVGGQLAVISQYPSIAALLYSTNGNYFNQACVGTIVTTKAILTAGHCVYGDAAFKWRVRVASSWANSGVTPFNRLPSLVPTITYLTIKLSGLLVGALLPPVQRLPSSFVIFRLGLSISTPAPPVMPSLAPT